MPGKAQAVTGLTETEEGRVGDRGRKGGRKEGMKEGRQEGGREGNEGRTVRGAALTYMHTHPYVYQYGVCE